MVQALGWAFAALLSGVAARSPLWSREAMNNGTEPCRVARSEAQFGIGSQLKPSLALACLASVPLNLDRDTELIDSLIPYVEQQSTIGYLKNPPDSYLFPPIDLIGGLKQIKEKLQAGGYRSQLDFAWDVNMIYNQVYDGHFDYRPALLTVFGFQVSRSLVSVSSDGLELPKVYDQEDMHKTIKNKQFKPSEIVSIDGISVFEYLQIVAANSALQDPDAQYNNLFSSGATIARGGGQYFKSGGYVELPDFSVYKYANGSIQSFPNYAILQQDLTNIDTGRDLHLAYEIPAPEKAAVSSSLSVKATATATSTTSSATGTATATTTGTTTTGTTTTSTTTSTATPTKKSSSKGKESKTTAAPSSPTVVGYPYPVVKHYNDYIAGYFLNDTDYKDVAVLSIFSFSPKAGATRTTREFHEFRRVVRKFIEECRKEKRTKLIIDVSANGGGLLFQSYELYRNLFPKANPPFDGTRIRATDAWNVIGKDIYGTKLERSAFNNILDKDLKRYPDWKAVEGPFTTKEDKYSNLLRYNFTKLDTVGEKDFIVSGYDPKDKAPEPHFEAKDIVLVSDGFCASTCTILARMLTHEQGVKTLALGGRPIKGAMQVAGGVKGAQVIKYNAFQQILGAALKKLPAGSKRPDGLPNTDKDLPLMPPLSGLQFNFRNAYKDANSEVPQQFIYEAATCKRFYTYDMTRSPVEAWKVAASVAFKGGKCVEGSSTGKDGTLGSEAPKLDREKVKAKQPAYSGPGSRVYTDRKFPATQPNRRWVAAARKANLRRDLNPRELSPHDRELLNRKPVDHGNANWWDHTGF